jgi:membrane-bound inhibitor of C-type lysozyme
MIRTGKILLLCLIAAGCGNDVPNEARAMQDDPDLHSTGKVPADAVDPARAVASVFDCGDNLSVTVAFVGPETIRINLPDGSHTLQRERSASGARYAAEGILFWNKGDEALLDIGGVEHNCKKSRNDVN